MIHLLRIYIKNVKNLHKSSSTTSTSKANRLVLVATLLLLSACQAPSNVDLTCDVSPGITNNQSQKTNQKSSNITIAIHLDGTPSMQGFVKNFTNSNYIKTLNLLDTAATTGWSKSQSTIKYYRFGTESQQLKNREAYLQAQLPDFYSGSEVVFQESQIETAMANSSPDKGKNPNVVSIVVTDLYQKDSDMNLLLDNLKSKYLQKGYAVGILAVKSQFNGMVYDVGIRGDKFSYNTEGKPVEKFHPFYVIFLGSYENIAQFYSEMNRQGADFIDVTHLVIFYPQLIKELSTLSLEKESTKFPKGINRLKTMWVKSNNINVALKTNEQPVELLSINSSLSKDDTFKNKTSYEPLPYTLKAKLDSSDRNDSLGVDIKVKVFDPATKSFKEQAPNNQSTQQALTFNSSELVDDKNIYVNTKIDPTLLKDGTYFYTIDLVAKELIEPKWWQEWNSDGTSLDGSKTDNVLPFLRGLKNLTLEIDKPVIGRLCYVVQKS